MLKKRYRRSTRVVKRDVAGEHLLIPVAGSVADVDKIFVLEGTGDFVWGLLDGETTCGAIAERVVHAFETTVEQAQEDVRTFVDRLRRAKLVEEVE